jgi:signal transduction histidine kinase
MIAMENARLSQLIDNFLTFSRLERGKHRFDIQPADAAEVVRRAVDAVAEQYSAAGAALRVGAAQTLPIRGDAGALVTVVVNLLDNALKYTSETKCVAVTAQREGDRVRIAVEDNGIGLSPRAARRVFDRFYQVDQRLSRASGGCGLGLSIVKSIVEAHGGRVTVESRLGEGSTFSVTLSLDQTAPSRMSMPPQQAESVTTEH